MEINPDYTAAYSMRGIAKGLLGDCRGVCADWRRATSLGESNSVKWVREKCN